MNPRHSADWFSVRPIVFTTIANQHKLEFTTMGDVPRKTNSPTRKLQLSHLCVSENLYFCFPRRSEMFNVDPQHPEEAKASRV
jgi:hypothetical protein